MKETVKVYKVTEMMELAFEGLNRPAIETALEWAKNATGIWTQADCEMVAVLMVNHIGAVDEDTQ